MVQMGDPARRSCDACESFGAMVKKLIKHSTVRRRLRKATHNHQKLVGGSRRRWKQTFTRGYIEQAFTCACVREHIRHGEENKRYLQRVDALRAATGRATSYHKLQDECEPNPSIHEAAKAFRGA